MPNISNATNSMPVVITIRRQCSFSLEKPYIRIEGETVIVWNQLDASNKQGNISELMLMASDYTLWREPDSTYFNLDIK